VLGSQFQTVSIRAKEEQETDGLEEGKGRTLSVTKKSATRNSSTSTVTESFSSRKPLQSSSVLEAHAATETSLSSSVMSKYQNLRPKSSFRGPRKTCNVKRVTSQVAGKGSSVARISDFRSCRTQEAFKSTQ
ncbi:hypothetical protein BHE74_00045219, partial [Ensete ventricosum]